MSIKKIKEIEKSFTAYFWREFYSLFAL